MSSYKTERGNNSLPGGGGGNTMVSGQSERSTQRTWNHKRGVFDYCHTKNIRLCSSFSAIFALLASWACLPLFAFNFLLFPPGPGTYAPPRAWCGTGSAPPPCPRGAARPKPTDRSPATRGGAHPESTHGGLSGPKAGDCPLTGFRSGSQKDGNTNPASMGSPVPGGRGKRGTPPVRWQETKPTHTSPNLCTASRREGGERGSSVPVRGQSCRSICSRWT